MTGTPVDEKNRDLLVRLDASARDALANAAEPVVLRAGSALFSAGENGDCLYFVVTGSLGVYVNRQADQVHLIALIGAGETVGEMALISDAPRSATVTAIRDSELLKIKSSDFETLVKDHPQLALLLNRLLVQRLRDASHGKTVIVDPRITAILPGSTGVDTRDFARRLRHELEAQGHTVYIAGAREASKAIGWLSDYESIFSHVLLCADGDHEQWLRRCTRQADRILIVARSGQSPCPEIKSATLQKHARHQLLDLVVLHPEQTRQPVGTFEWHQHYPVNRQFHVRSGKQGDWERLARIITGTAVGVVLSGGGARAYAHIGVLRALKEFDIDVDFVGGCSMGGIIAACIAMNWDIEEIGERICDCFVESNPLSDYSLPIVGLVRGHKVESLLKKHFSSVELPDMWLPFFCVSSNLTTGETHVHKTGMVREALRASVSLPGILPPVAVDEGLLVDGGVTANLPVDIMRATTMGPVIAVDVARDLSLTPEWLSREANAPFYRRLLRPPIITILMRSGTVTGEEANRLQSEQADLVIAPELGEIEIRDWKSYGAAVEIGYRHAVDLLKKSPEIVKTLGGKSPVARRV